MGGAGDRGAQVGSGECGGGAHVPRPQLWPHLQPGPQVRHVLEGGGGPGIHKTPQSLCSHFAFFFSFCLPVLRFNKRTTAVMNNIYKVFTLYPQGSAFTCICTLYFLFLCILGSAVVTRGDAE